MSGVDDIGKVVGGLAGGVVTGGASSVLDVFASLFKLWATPGGQNIIEHLLPSAATVKAEQEKLDAALAAERMIGPDETR